jgi:hypothetical protein
MMTFKQALIIVHKLAAPNAATDEEIEALDEVQCHFETMWSKKEEDENSI